MDLKSATKCKIPANKFRLKYKARSLLREIAAELKPRRRRLSAAPRKAKCLEWKSTAPIQEDIPYFQQKSDPDTYRPAFSHS
jgi:hypothetical protein